MKFKAIYRQVSPSKFELQTLNFWLFFLLVILSSCEYFKKSTIEPKGDTIARVDNDYLYYTDLEPLMKQLTGNKDSAAIVKSHVDDWIKRKLMLQKARAYLPELNIERQVQDYKESLILYNYEKELILQKMDTLVADSILLNYFTEYKTNFALKSDVVQMLYIKVPKDAPRVDSLSIWIASKNEADKIKLEDYCHQYATECSLSDSMWYEIPLVYKNIPINPYQLEMARLNRNPLVAVDSLFNYVMKINASMAKGEIAPFAFVKSDITRIILNKRKNELVRSTLENVYLEGKRNKKFEIYEK